MTSVLKIFKFGDPGQCPELSLQLVADLIEVVNDEDSDKLRQLLAYLLFNSSDARAYVDELVRLGELSKADLNLGGSAWSIADDQKLVDRLISEKWETPLEVAPGRVDWEAELWHSTLDLCEARLGLATDPELRQRLEKARDGLADFIDRLEVDEANKELDRLQEQARQEREGPLFPFAFRGGGLIPIDLEPVGYSDAKEKPDDEEPTSRDDNDEGSER